MNTNEPLEPNDSKLRIKAMEVSLKQLRTKTVQAEIDQLLDYVYARSNKGEERDRKKPSVVGLAANQLGLPNMIAVVDLGVGRKGYSDVHVIVNPKITWSSKSLIAKDEGCVNLKYIRGIVPRSKRVKVECLDRSGNKMTLDLNGWAAVLLQHEVGHLNGELFIDHLPDKKRAHLVEENDFLEYKKNKNDWDKFIDVSSLAKDTL